MFLRPSYCTIVLALLLVAQVYATKKIVVVGSVNADTFLPVERLPVEGENLVCLSEPTVDVPGGKGCTQAVAAAKLLLKNPHEENSVVAFVGQFGSDAVASSLQNVLNEAQVDISKCGGLKGAQVSSEESFPTGRGYVFLSRATGQVSAVVSGGSNHYGWKTVEQTWENYKDSKTLGESIGWMDRILQDCSCLLLQREVPEFVNRLFASLANSQNIPVLQDIGGSDRPMSASHMACCTYLIPNETELKRLVLSFGYDEATLPKDVVGMAKILQSRGARNVLVTEGINGSTLVSEQGEQVYHQPSVKTESVVDETGAGDAYRAAFSVALLEGKSPQECMKFASAAGSLAVEKHGAVPSTPSRTEVEKRYQSAPETEEISVLSTKSGLSSRGIDGGPATADADKDGPFPFLVGSRLNSMKDRPELWDQPLSTPKDFVRRQSTIRGLTCVDFNYPQHFHDWKAKDAKKALNEAGLLAGAVCLRYPAKFARGAMNHPNTLLRREAIDLTKEAAEVANQLGCNEVVVWSAFDGYDYPFQVDYDNKWQELVEAFRECCDAFPHIKFSVEYKPTDENTRFFAVPSTGAAMLLVSHVDRENFGLTLDVGHMLMSGENPGQSIAMAGSKLFGIQLNDGFTRLAAEDGLMFGSVHPGMALEIMYQLRRIGFKGHFYFDTFPQRSDPVKEAEYNIERAKAFWNASGRLSVDKLSEIWKEHDAIAALRLVDDALRSL
mmetsp:Transcript_17380/g.47446  ORF Transcript_17380/g.47446 Transcript_17380/m.47446 type:complete len:725 (+) Transcript_17380:126-2300(+)|eukprot:CAMPEP_0168724118 /NCGR_PEP_ID=MMETSP0724-20121128/3470_1 /TAXON_ID=265536 /ORGANISM="Amphiprora sp., Strain CCMP467" /LENGTH=724 /DNA_ID=CAMNT_0008770855 /DNA_START=88 /DNA_END=2262 /DNA_ORIENTATION=-